MGKQKTDEQRAADIAHRIMPMHLSMAAIAATEEAIKAGLRSERRAIKRKQAETLRRLLAKLDPSPVYSNDWYKQEGIRACIKALGLKVKP